MVATALPATGPLAFRATDPAVLYTSATLLAVDKPTGIIVHGDGTGVTTLTDLVRNAVAAERLAGVDPACAPALQALQRLDRATSGIVLFSVCKQTQAAYDRMLAEHACEKRYLAIVHGRVPWREHTFTDPIGRDRHDARRMRVSRTGKAACTCARVLDMRCVRDQWLSLLEVQIETGRKHQIRVHLAHAGFPLLGDELYGRPDPRGLMLHAHTLRFADPVSGEAVNITAPAPARLRALFPRTLA